MKRYLLITVCLLALTNVSYGQRSFSSLSKLSAQTYKYWKQLPKEITKDYRNYFAFSAYIVSHYNQGKTAPLRQHCYSIPDKRQHTDEDGSQPQKEI